MRLLAHFSIEGKRRGETIRDAFNDEQLSQELKAQIEWIVARQDRVWYVLADAREKLLSLGFTEDAIFSLDSDWLACWERERALFHLARQLAASPVVLSDPDVARCLGQAGPAEVVRTIQYVTRLIVLNRLSESAGLAVE